MKAMSHDEARKILGVQPGATPEEVRTAFRERAKRVHPDMREGSREEWDALEEAYTLLAAGDITPLHPGSGTPHQSTGERLWWRWRGLPRLPRAAIVGVGGAVANVAIGWPWISWCVSQGIPWEIPALVMYYPALWWLWATVVEVRRPPTRPLYWYRIPIPEDAAGQDRLIQWLRDQERHQTSEK